MIELTEMKNGYNGKPTCLETMTFDPDIHDKPGVYLQHVEGGGYTVYEMTLEQAEALAKELLDAAKECRESFEEKK